MVCVYICVWSMDIYSCSPGLNVLKKKCLGVSVSAGGEHGRGVAEILGR